MRADTGPIGGDLSHEFIILADTGESAGLLRQGAGSRPTSSRADVDYDERPRAVLPAVDPALCRDRREARSGALARFRRSSCVEARGIEVGHIFYFGTKYSKPMGATVAGPERRDRSRSEMGSYGIGVSRLVGAIIEASHDEPASSGRRAWRRSRSALINLRVADDDVPRRRRRSLPQASEPQGRGALRRPRRVAGRQVRRHGSDRPALAAGGRAARPRAGQGRAQAAQDRHSARRLPPEAAIAQAASAGASMVFNAFERMVAFRYLRARRQEGFVSVIADLLAPRHRARRGDAHHRHVGDERLPRRVPGPHPRHQRPSRRHAPNGGRHQRLRRRSTRRSARCRASSRCGRWSKARCWRRTPRTSAGVLVRGMRAEDIASQPLLAGHIDPAALKRFLRRQRHHRRPGWPIASACAPATA